MPLILTYRSIARTALPAVAMGFFLSAVPVSAQTVLSSPIGPEGSARTLGMENTVVAIGGDAGAVASNPATLTSVGPHGGDDLTIGAGARGTELFGAHVYGGLRDQVPSAIWGAVLSGPQAQEQLVAFSVATPDSNGLDVGGTLRYERWQSGGISDANGNADVGVRYTSPNFANTRAWSLGASALNLLHPAPFHGTPISMPTDTEIIGAAGYNIVNKIQGEIDYVYTSHHKYARIGAETKIAGPAWVRAGISDRNYSLGASYLKSGYNLSASLNLVSNQHALFSIGASSKF